MAQPARQEKEGTEIENRKAEEAEKNSSHAFWSWSLQICDGAWEKGRWI